MWIQPQQQLHHKGPHSLQGPRGLYIPEVTAVSSAGQRRKSYSKQCLSFFLGNISSTTDYFREVPTRAGSDSTSETSIKFWRQKSVGIKLDGYIACLAESLVLR